MGDVSFELDPEVKALRATAFAAFPNQALDSTTILVAEIVRVRALFPAASNLDTNTELERNWDGA